DAVDDVDLLLADQALDLVDRHIGLALRVGVDRRDLVLAADAAALVAQIDGDLRADRAGDRAAGRERPGVIEDDADAHRFGLGLGVPPVEAQGSSGSGRIFQKRSARSLHWYFSRILGFWRRTLPVVQASILTTAGNVNDGTIRHESRCMPGETMISFGN